MTVAAPPSDALSQALSNLSDHLRALMDDVACVERAVAALQSSPSAPAPRDLVDLQRIDMVQQTLDDLAALTALMAQGDTSPDTVSYALKLAATRALVAPEDVVATNGAAAGEIDLF